VTSGNHNVSTLPQCAVHLAYLTLAEYVYVCVTE